MANIVSHFQSVDDIYDSSVIEDKPLGYWKLNEKIGTTIADSVGVNSGIVSGPGVLNSTPLLSSVSDSSFLSASTSDIALSSVPLTGDVSNYSMEAWFVLDVIGQTHYIFRSEDAGGTDFNMSLGIFNSNKISHGKFPPVGGGLLSTQSVIAGKIYHVVYVESGSSRELYVNGILDISDTSSETYTGAAITQSIIGNDSAGSFGLQGRLGHVAIYNYSLTAAQVRKHYLAGRGIRRYQLEMLSQAPVGYWSLNETSGTTAVDEIGTSNGTYINSPTLGSTSLIKGDKNYSVEFSGTNQYITVPATGGSAIDLTSGGSVSLWFNADTITSTDMLISRYHSSTNTTDISVVLTPGLLTWRSDDGSTILTTPVTTGRTYHIVGTFNGTAWNLYKDGILVDTLATAVTGMTTSEPWLFAVDADATAGGSLGNYFDGKLDNVAIFDRELTQEEIMKQYLIGRAKHNYQSVVRQDLPVGYWRLGESSGTTAFDEINNINATYGGDFTLGASGGLNNDSNTGVLFASGTGDGETLNNSLLPDPTESISIECWFKTTSTATNKTLLVVRRSVSGGVNTSLAIRISNAIAGQLDVNHGGAQTNSTTIGLHDDIWHHVVGTWDSGSGDLKIYVDGIFESSNTAPSGNSGISRTYISNNLAINHFDGTLDEPAVYNYVLSEYQIRKHYLTGIATSLRYPKEVLASNPISYWRLGETSGTTTFDEMNNNDGTMSNVYTLNSPGLLINDNNAAIDFTSGRMTVNNTVLGGGDINIFSIEVWIKVDNLPGASTAQICMQANSSTGDVNIGFTLRSTGEISFDKFPPSALAFDSSSIIKIGHIYQIVYVENGPSRKIYINGILDNSDSSSEVYTGATTNVFFIGNRTDNGRPFDGIIDEVSIYDRDLTAIEILNHYNAGKDIKRLP